jgi:hypothetical protein
MGQIRKRGDYYRTRYYRHGQRIEESMGFTRYEEARDLLREREGAISKDVPITANSIRLTFDDAVQDVVTDYTVNAARSGTTKNQAGRVFPFTQGHIAAVRLFMYCRPVVSPTVREEALRIGNKAKADKHLSFIHTNFGELIPDDDEIEQTEERALELLPLHPDGDMDDCRIVAEVELAPSI